MKKPEFNPEKPSALEPGFEAVDLVSGADAPQERAAVVNRLFREHNRSLMNFLVMRLRSAQEARDVAQEAYVRILQLDRTGAVSLMRAYLFRVAGNLATDRLRRRAVRERAADELFEDMAGDAPERAVLARQELDLVHETLQTLPEKCRQAFVLHVIDGLPTPEVARRMGLRERMVRMHVARALTECKLRLNGAGEST